MRLENLKNKLFKTALCFWTSPGFPNLLLKSPEPRFAWRGVNWNRWGLQRGRSGRCLRRRQLEITTQANTQIRVQLLMEADGPHQLKAIRSRASRRQPTHTRGSGREGEKSQTDGSKNKGGKRRRGEKCERQASGNYLCNFHSISRVAQKWRREWGIHWSCIWWLCSWVALIDGFLLVLLRFLVYIWKQSQIRACNVEEGFILFLRWFADGFPPCVRNSTKTMFSMNKSADDQSFFQTEILRPSGFSDGSSDSADVVKHCLGFFRLSSRPWENI